MVRPLHVDDFRWAAIRQHPRDAQCVVVLRAEAVLAVLPARRVRFWRALLLNSWPKLSSSFRVNEMDVVAFVVAIVLSQQRHWPAEPAAGQQFRGDQHVFADWEHVLEPGYFRPASLPRFLGVVPFGDPSTSAYTRVEGFGSPLNAAGHAAVLEGHPTAAVACNAVRYGFPLFSEPPAVTRRARHVARNPSTDEQLREQEQIELGQGAFISADGWDRRVPIRYAAWFAAERNGKVRGVSDLSDGADSANDMARREPQLPARLASWQAVAGRILYLQEQRPGVGVSLAKLDVRRAFRQCPLPVRDFWKAGHVLRGQRVVHTRLCLGATCSVDSMSAPISAIQDVAAREGFFLQSYVDDQLLVDYDDHIDRAVAWVKAAWRLAGWPLNEDKYLAEGAPAHVKEFLGVSVDTDRRTAAVTPRRLTAITLMLKAWLAPGFRPGIKRLQSLAGTLNFVAAVIPFGKVFLHRLYAAGRDLDAGISMGLTYDLRWWQHALHEFNGIASFAPLDFDAPVVHVSTDAAKAGWGAVNPAAEEFAAGAWRQDEVDAASAAQWEAAAVVLACDLWGESAAGGVLVVHSDSIASVAVMSRLAAHDERMFNLLRCAVDLQLQHRFRLVLQHIPGVSNGLSDTASRVGHLPESHRHFVRRFPGTGTRHSCGLALTAQPCETSPAPSHRGQPYVISDGTVISLDTTPRPTLPWIVWNTQRWTCPDEGVFST